MLAELGDGREKSIVGGLIEEDGVVGFLFDFSLGPFLGVWGCTLGAAFFFEAALAMSPLLFFSTALGMWI